MYRPLHCRALADRVSRPGVSARADDGYGLVEVLVSVTLFMVIATAAGPGLVTALRYAESNENRVVAAGLAAAQIELARAGDPASLTVGTATVSIDPNGTPFTVKRMLYPVVGCGEDPPTRRITINVQWPGSGIGVFSDTTSKC